MKSSLNVKLLMDAIEGRKLYNSLGLQSLTTIIYLTNVRGVFKTLPKVWNETFYGYECF